MGWWETTVSCHPTYPTLPDTTGPKKLFCQVFVMAFMNSKYLTAHQRASFVEFTEVECQFVEYPVVEWPVVTLEDLTSKDCGTAMLPFPPKSSIKHNLKRQIIEGHTTEKRSLVNYLLDRFFLKLQSRFLPHVTLIIQKIYIFFFYIYIFLTDPV